MDIQTAYQTDIKYAASKHGAKNQKVPGTDLHYLLHVSNVAMEILVAGPESDNFNAAFGVEVALVNL